MGTPEIYVECLASRDISENHGVWIDATLPFSSIENDITAMMERSEYKNGLWHWAVTEWRGFCDLTLPPHISLRAIWNLAKGISQYGEAFALRADDVGVFLGGGIFERDFIGTYGSFHDFIDECEQAIEDELDSLRFPSMLLDAMEYVHFDRDNFHDDVEGIVTMYEGSEGTHIFRD